MDLTFTVDVPENIARFVTAFRQILDPRSYRFYISDVNGFLYLKCKTLFKDDLDFIYRSGFKVLTVSPTFEDNYYLDVCLLPNN